MRVTPLAQTVPSLPVVACHGSVGFPLKMRAGRRAGTETGRIIRENQTKNRAGPKAVVAKSVTISNNGRALFVTTICLQPRLARVIEIEPAAPHVDREG